MKKIIHILLAVLIIAGCTSRSRVDVDIIEDDGKEMFYPLTYSRWRNSTKVDNNVYMINWNYDSKNKIKVLNLEDNLTSVIEVDPKQLCNLISDCKDKETDGIYKITHGENNLYFTTNIEDKIFLVSTDLKGKNMKVIHKYTSSSGDGSNIEFVAVKNTLYFKDSDEMLSSYSADSEKQEVIINSDTYRNVMDLRYDLGIGFVVIKNETNDKTHMRYGGDRTFISPEIFDEEDVLISPRYRLALLNDKIEFKLLDEGTFEFEYSKDMIIMPESIVTVNDLLLVPFYNQKENTTEVTLYSIGENVEHVESLYFDNITGISFVSTEKHNSEESEIIEPYYIVFETEKYQGEDLYETEFTISRFSSEGFTKVNKLN